MFGRRQPFDRPLPSDSGGENVVSLADRTVGGVVGATKTLDEAAIIERCCAAIRPLLAGRIDLSAVSAMPRDDLSRNLQTIVDEVVEERFPEIAGEALMRRQIVTALLDELLVDSKTDRVVASDTEVTSSRRSVDIARQRIHHLLLSRIHPTVTSQPAPA